MVKNNKYDGKIGFFCVLTCSVVFCAFFLLGQRCVLLCSVVFCCVLLCSGVLW